MFKGSNNGHISIGPEEREFIRAKDDRPKEYAEFFASLFRLISQTCKILLNICIFVSNN